MVANLLIPPHNLVTRLAFALTTFAFCGFLFLGRDGFCRHPRRRPVIVIRPHEAIAGHSEPHDRTSCGWPWSVEQGSAALVPRDTLRDDAVPVHNSRMLFFLLFFFELVSRRTMVDRRLVRSVMSFRAWSARVRAARHWVGQFRACTEWCRS